MLAVSAPMPADAMHGLIAGLYLATNGGRVFSYVPQIVALHRCRDGAGAISLATWLFWLVSHVTALLYGGVIVRDPFFVLVCALNLAGCATVTAMIVRRRRGLACRKQNGPLARPVSALRGS